MTAIIDLEKIKQVLATLDYVPLIEAGFVAYSNGQSVIPPIGELKLKQGEVHIKYGFIQSQPYYVIKIASGFYNNAALGLSTSNGCMLVFSQNTGELKSVLLDEGHLTDIRTAAAGAIAAKHLAPKKVNRIGIVGTGIQARLQLEHLRSIVDCRSVLVCGRSNESLAKFETNFENSNSNTDSTNFEIQYTRDLVEIQSSCNLIVTTTPTETPLLHSQHLLPGTHITAVGSDTPEKQELDSEILSRANLVVADSIEQCQSRGEISQAIRNGKLETANLTELGNVISGKSSGRTTDDQITIVDLTGVAVQDIQIATAIANTALSATEGAERVQTRKIKANSGTEAEISVDSGLEKDGEE